MTPVPVRDPNVVIWNDDGSHGVDPHGVQRVLEDLAKAAIDTGGRQLKMRVGSSSQTMPAAVNGAFALTHGLGTTPVAAFAIADGGTANDMTVGTTAYTATQFTVTWRRASGFNAPTPCVFFWVAFG